MAARMKALLANFRPGHPGRFFVCGAITVVLTKKGRGCLPNLQHILGDFPDSLRPECGPSFHRDIDFGDWEALALEHGLTCSAVILTTSTLRNVGEPEDHPTSASARSGASLLASVYPAAASAPMPSGARARPAQLLASAGCGIMDKTRGGETGNRGRVMPGGGGGMGGMDF